MPLELDENPEQGTLQVAVSGKLSADDNQTFVPAVSQLIDSVGKVMFRGGQAADSDGSDSLD